MSPWHGRTHCTCLVQPSFVSSHRIDVRILAATNADLTTKIAAGSFRADLYYSLARFVVQVPPLRQRQDDIQLLALHFLALFADEMGIEAPLLDEAALDLLKAYTYPGNVRELKNIIARALPESRGFAIQVHHLHLGTVEGAATPPFSGQAAAEALYADETLLYYLSLKRS